MSELGELIGWHTVVVRRFLGEGSNGPRYSAAVNLPCTVTKQTDVTVTATGNIESTATTLTFEADQAGKINASALVLLPGETQEREVTGLSVTTAPDPFTGFDVGIATVT